MKQQFLITVPSFKILGGVSSHYYGLMPFWKSTVHFFTIGKRKKIPAYFTIIPDYIRFFFYLLFHRQDAILINSSLRIVPVFRDALFLLICRLFRRKAAVFFHGWDPATYERIKQKHSRLFCWAFNKAQFIYLLSSEFRDNMQQLGISVPIKLTTTKVNDKLLEGFDINSRDGKVDQIIFLARADKEKGLDITLKAFEILKAEHPELKLCVCGDGNVLQACKEYAHSHNIADVTFHGTVPYDLVKTHLTESQIYILPTMHGEGMPTSILEAMAFGLVVISRPIGGINDFFVEKEMGTLIESLEPGDYARYIDELINNPEMVKAISRRNYHYAVDHFMASRVAESMERDLSSI